jgi:hypothetical protein
MNPLVISLDTPTGKARREALNFPHNWQRATTFKGAPAFLKERCRMMYNINPKAREGTIGCFGSHYKIWKAIIQHGWEDVVVCEDDARLQTVLPAPDTLPKDGACLLGGEICEPTKWKLNEQWKKEKRESIIAGFKQGANRIDYTRFRWRCTVAIYYPNADAVQDIVNRVEACPRITHPDLTLAKLWAIKYLYFPTVFDCNDGGISQVQGGGKQQTILRDYKEQRLAA